MPDVLKSRERGLNEIHMKCATALVYYSDGYKMVMDEYAHLFTTWTQSNNFWHCEDIGGAVWRLKESSIYALLRKCILKVTEFGGNYRVLCKAAKLQSAEETHLLPESFVDKIIPYLKHAVEFKLNVDANMIPPASCTQVDPITHPYAYNLLDKYNTECRRQRNANFEANGSTDAQTPEQ